MMFLDRQEAGSLLAPHLIKYKNSPETLVIGLPRGGIICAAEVAKFLNLPLDVITPRKVGSPYNPELALGAVTHTGDGYFNLDIISQLGVSESFLKQEIEKEKAISLARQKLYRKNKPPLDVRGKTIILVDDGLATGATMKAAIQSMKSQGAKKIIAAIPVSPPDTLEEIRAMCQEVVCLDAPAYFQAVGQFYSNFQQTSDEEVIQLLKPSSE